MVHRLDGVQMWIERLGDVGGLAHVRTRRSTSSRCRAVCTVKTLTSVAIGLKAAEYVYVAPRPTAGRALPVTLTDMGQAVLDQADAIVLDREKRLITGLPSAEVARLASLLTTCAQNLTTS